MAEEEDEDVAGMNNIFDMLTSADATTWKQRTLDPKEVAEERADELEALTEIFGDEFTMISMPDAGPAAEADPTAAAAASAAAGQETVFRLQVKPVFAEAAPDDMIGLGGESIWLTFVLSTDYPFEVPIFEIESAGCLSPAHEDQLYESLLVQSVDSIGYPMVYDLWVAANEFVGTIFEARRVSLLRSHIRMKTSRRRPADSKERGPEEATSSDSESDDGVSLEHVDELATLAQAMKAAKAASDKEAYASARAARKAAKKAAKVVAKAALDERKVEDIAALLVDNDALQPHNFVGSLAAVIRKVTSTGVCIHRVENVVRRDLAVRFLHKRDSMMKRYGDNADSAISVGFHGTDHKVVGKIVSSGLLVPGSRGVHTAHGERFGNGIYLSPNPQKSLNYVYSWEHGGKLLVCAALRGRVAELGDWGGISPEERRKCDSASGDRGNEWILFKASQVMPVYVLHFHWNQAPNVAYTMVSAGGTLLAVTSDQRRHGAAPPRTRAGVSEDEYKDARREARMAAAEFYFGSRLRVVGLGPDASDDEDTTDTAVMMASKVALLDEDGMDEGEFQAEREAGGQWNTSNFEEDLL